MEIAPELGTGRYVPPSVRAATGVPERRRLEGFSIRVTNLPENTNEADLRDIFQRFGTVIRIFPAKDKRTQLNRVSQVKCILGIYIYYVVDWRSMFLIKLYCLGSRYLANWTYRIFHWFLVVYIIN